MSRSLGERPKRETWDRQEGRKGEGEKEGRQKGRNDGPRVGLATRRHQRQDPGTGRVIRHRG
jgi:hypothetical protein